MKYLKIDKYIVSLDGVHGVLIHATSLHSTQAPATKLLKNEIIITYASGVSACLDFANKEEAQKAFDKIAEVLGAN